MFLVLINPLVVCSLKCQKILKNAQQCFSKPLNVFFCPQPKDISVFVTEEKITIKGYQENIHTEEGGIRGYWLIFLKKKETN